MREMLRNYLNRVFEEAPKTRRMLELKEELLVNLEERYDDLVAGGYTPEDACENAVQALGNVEDLLMEMDMMDKREMENSTAMQKKHALLHAIAIGMYIFAGAVFFFFVMLEDSGILPGNLDGSILALVLAILLCIPPVCMQVYISCADPKYVKKNDTVVEEFREWKNNNSRQKEIKTSINSILWSLTFVIYLAISFSTCRWDVSWIIFLITPCLTAIVRLIFSLKEDGKES